MSDVLVAALVAIADERVHVVFPEPIHEPAQRLLDTLGVTWSVDASAPRLAERLSSYDVDALRVREQPASRTCALTFLEEEGRLPTSRELSRLANVTTRTAARTLKRIRNEEEGKTSRPCPWSDAA